jgi:prolyl-tRNA synthetase
MAEDVAHASHASPLTAQREDFPRWYQDVVARAELAENGPARGTMVIRPYGYAIWENIQAALDARIKRAGASNAYFPLLIPQRHLDREADHVEGFSPELAVVTHAGGRMLDEPLVVRPTSETIIGDCMSRWIQSHRDLPLLLNQWANVVRWELRPRLFLRTVEFLWQEGHTAHASEREAAAYARRIHLDVYRDFLERELAVPVHVGRKTARERFAGASNTLTCEAMMADGKALQMATSHELGQNFARAFGITYLARDGRERHVWTTSWGSSTRMLGGLIMGHGDDAGLQVPPRLAPVQVVIIPVRDDPALATAAARIEVDLAAQGTRVQVDTGDRRFGRKVVDWELKGVPLRVELGRRDLDRGQVTIVRRDRREKTLRPVSGLPDAVVRLLEEVQRAMTDAARERLLAGTRDAVNVTEAIEAGKVGLARIPWARLADRGEDELAEHALTIRCVQRADGSIPDAENEPDLFAIVGRSY